MTIGEVDATSVNVVPLTTTSSMMSPVSPSTLNNGPLTSSPTLMALKARVNADWKDLIYREALRMAGSLRQLLAQYGNSSSSRSQLIRNFLERFNEMLLELRRPTGLDGNDADLHSLSSDFEALLGPWIEILQSQDLVGPLLHAALVSVRAFLHSGMLTDANSPFSRLFVHDLVFSLAHSRFEPTSLELDEIVMLELIEFLAELVQVTIAAFKTSSGSNEEIVGETFIFQLFDLLFVLLNQNRFSELLRSKAVDIVVELSSLLFSVLKKLNGNVIITSRTTTIHFPNIIKPQKPLPVSSTNNLSSSSRAASQSPKSTSPIASDSVVNVNLRHNEAVVSEDSPVIASPYNPFTDEAEDDLAPDAIEEVMKFRAKIAGISLESDESESIDSEVSFDLSLDRLSSHCLKEILLFLIRCIDIIDTPKKAPGSIKSDSNNAASQKAIPTLKTQMTAMKCLVAIFTDPISELSTKKTPQTLTPFEVEIVTLIGDDLLKQLLAILSLDGSSRHLSSLSQLLLVIFTNYRPFLPAQFEYFISTCLSIISSKPYTSIPSSSAASNSSSTASTPNVNNFMKTMSKPVLTALKTTCLETLAYFLQDSSVIAQIFVFYECSLDYPNTLEGLTKGIAAGMEKSSGNEEIIGLSGEILCNFIKTIESSLARDHSRTEIEDLKCLLEQRRLKLIYSEASALFNSNPKEAFPFLQQKGLLSSTASPTEIADFLRKAQGLDKKMLGEFLVKPSNIEILREFFSAFKFSESTSIDSALRQVLESFRLPGEAQQIDRIMECFSEIYYPSARATFSSQDACYVLAFSTLMLNTDLHNPQVKHKMTLPDFVRNNRGINDGKDVDSEYLGELYNSIKTREIVMPEEHGGEEAFTSQWNEVQRRASVFEMPSMTRRNFHNLCLSPLVCGIVEIVWKPIITSLIPYINQQRPTGEVISEGPLESLRGIASLFEKFEMTEALEALLGNIWSVSNLIPVFSAASGNMIPRYLARLPGFRQVVRLIVDIFQGQGDGLRVSWTNWCRLLIILSESNLLPVDAVVTQEGVIFDSKLEPVSLLSLIKMAHEARQVQPAGKQSFMSSLSRFFVSSNTTATSETVSVNTTNTDDITGIARQFVVNQLPIIEVLRDTIPRMQSSKSFSACVESFCLNLKWNLGDSPGGLSGGSKRGSSTASAAALNWTEDTLILLVESLVTIGLSVEPERLLDDALPLVFDALTRLVLQDSTPPARLCEHGIIGLGRLLLSLAEVRKLPIGRFVGYLKFWCQLSPQLQGLTLEPALSVISLIFSKLSGDDSSSFESIWPPLFTILSTVSKLDYSAPYTLRLLQLIASVKFPLDFFTEYLDLLSCSVVGCTETNFVSKIYDPWRAEEKLITRGQLAEESIKLYEGVFNSLQRRNDDEEKIWRDFLIPLESNLSRHGPLHCVKRIRQQSINLLTRLIPQTPISLKSGQVAPILFSRILIPLLVDLRIRQGDSDDIVMRCASLTCKIFLSNLADLGLPAGQLWREILEALMPLLLNGNPSEALREGVLESCKNVLLVMHSTDEIRSDSDVWRVTDVLLGPLIPEWKLEIEMRMGEHIEHIEHVEHVEEVKTIKCEDENGDELEDNCDEHGNESEEHEEMLSSINDAVNLDTSDEGSNTSNQQQQQQQTVISFEV